MHRRHFLGGTLAGLAVAGVMPGMALSAPKRRLGLQLFTVMAQLEQDFDGTLQAVAAMGYREVETIGAFGRDPAQVRASLERHGLVSPSQHLIPGDLYEVFKGFTQRRVTKEQARKRWLEVMTVERVTPILEEGIARAQVLGQRYICWQALWPEQMATRQLVDRFCEAMNAAGELCAKSGLVFNFHNHSDEFKQLNGYVPYDVIVENTNPTTVKLELDVYWAIAGKADPVAYFTRYPGRYRQCHLKDGNAAGDLTTTGRGIVDFRAVLRAAAQAGVEHYYVEYDRADDPMAESRRSFDYLEKLM
jgi:sugar phosphate isomerase/epimerase